MSLFFYYLLINNNNIINNKNNNTIDKNENDIYKFIKEQIKNNPYYLMY